MTHDDYLQLRSMYADIDELCRGVEEADSAPAAEDGLRRLIGLFHRQQRDPEQIRSFTRHLGASEEVVLRLLGEVASEEGGEGASGGAS